MRTARTIHVSAINIAMHEPHSPSEYVRLIRAAYKSNTVLRFDSLHRGMIGSLHPIDDENPELGFTGEIYRFVKLDPNEPWFNNRTREEATSAELQAVNIPEHLLPHLQRFPFVFKPASHHLFYISHDRDLRLGPKSLEKFLQLLFDLLSFDEDFPPIEVTATPDREKLNEIFSLPYLSKLTIELRRPNSDSGQSEQERWQRKLERQKARRMTLVIDGVKGGTIEPDDDTRAMATVAASNGSVEASGKTLDGSPVRLSTTDKPLAKAASVESAVETTEGVLKRVADEIEVELLNPVGINV